MLQKLDYFSSVGLLGLVYKLSTGIAAGGVSSQYFCIPIHAIIDSGLFSICFLSQFNGDFVLVENVKIPYPG